MQLYSCTCDSRWLSLVSAESCSLLPIPMKHFGKYDAGGSVLYQPTAQHCTKPRLQLLCTWQARRKSFTSLPSLACGPPPQNLTASVVGEASYFSALSPCRPLSCSSSCNNNCSKRLSNIPRQSLPFVLQYWTNTQGSKAPPDIRMHSHQ